MTVYLVMEKLAALLSGEYRNRFHRHAGCSRSLSGDGGFSAYGAMAAVFNEVTSWRFWFGAVTMPIYSVCATHANDCQPSEDLY